MDDPWSNTQMIWHYFELVYQTYKPLVWTVLIGYFLIINYATYLMFKYDKARAIGRHHRISEAGLLQSAFIGGSLGAKVAQAQFRHKTRKEPFRTQLNAICVVHVMAAFTGVVWLLGYWPALIAEMN